MICNNITKNLLKKVEQRMSLTDNQNQDNQTENQDNQEQKRQRRVRYKGTHPKSYKEKYKELQPEKYADTVAKVIQKGSTPAGMHRSICVDEIIEFLQITPGQIGLDATLGYGGHTLEMLKCLDSKGHMYATDVDPIELPRTKERLKNLGYGSEILTTMQMNFSEIDKVALESGPLNFVLADLGVSSMQIDNPERGFTFKSEGPLDLRLNPNKGISAAERLKTISLDELEGMLVENSDEPHAAAIARAITSHIKKGMLIETTTQLKEIIKEAMKYIPGGKDKEAVKKTCQRCFQALRIDVNDEFEVLYEFLEKLPNALAPGGRVAILTFHSGEDRLVKKSFKRFLREGIYSEIAGDPIRPSAEECNTNSRARCAKLRWAIKA
jgi:16S rRNA (cytosine1402-N4)-methyltransferase